MFQKNNTSSERVTGRVIHPTPNQNEARQWNAVHNSFTYCLPVTPIAS